VLGGQLQRFVGMRHDLFFLPFLSQKQFTSFILLPQYILFSLCIPWVENILLTSPIVQEFSIFVIDDDFISVRPKVWLCYCIQLCSVSAQSHAFVASLGCFDEIILLSATITQRYVSLFRYLQLFTHIQFCLLLYNSLHTDDS